MILLVLLSHAFLCVPPSAAAAAAAVNPNGTKTLLANGLITIFINGKPLFSNGQRSLPRNPPDCAILDNWVVDSLILAHELYVNSLRRFATCLSANNDLCRKLVSSLELSIIFDDNLKLLQSHFLLLILIY